MAELVDARDLKSLDICHTGSIPVPGMDYIHNSGNTEIRHYSDCRMARKRTTGNKTYKLRQCAGWACRTRWNWHRVLCEGKNQKPAEASYALLLFSSMMNSLSYAELPWWTIFSSPFSSMTFEESSTSCKSRFSFISEEDYREKPGLVIRSRPIMSSLSVSLGS